MIINGISFSLNLSIFSATSTIIPIGIKSNIITEKVPLIITIRNNGSRLEIVNNLYEKPEDLKTKSGTGIKNIKERLKYFTEEELIMEKKDGEYHVSLPMMEVETL